MLCHLAALSWLAAPHAAFAAEPTTMPAAQQAVLLAKILAYDRRLPDRVGDQVVVIVAHTRSEAPHAEELVRELQRVAEHRRVADRPLVARAALVTDAGAPLTVEGASALFVTAGVHEPLGALLSEARARSIITFTDSPDQAARGVAIGLLLREDRPAIVVDLPESVAEGAELDATLLHLAEVHR